MDKPWHTECVQKQERDRAEEASPCSEIVELGLAQEGGKVCGAHAHCATKGDQLRGTKLNIYLNL